MHRNRHCAASLERPEKRPEDAEFLVLGLPLLEGIQATKAYTRYPGYDLIASNPERRSLCKIKVDGQPITTGNSPSKQTPTASDRHFISGYELLNFDLVI